MLEDIRIPVVAACRYAEDLSAIFAHSGLPFTNPLIRLGGLYILAAQEAKRMEVTLPTAQALLELAYTTINAEDAREQ